MAARISSLATSNPWLPLLIAALLAIGTAPLWLAAPRDLGVGALSSQGGAALTIAADSDPAVGRRVVAVALDATRSQLQSEPGVESVKTVRGGGSLRIEVKLRDDSPASRLRALREIPAAIDPGPLRIEVGGAESQLRDARRGLGGDLWRVALVALPFALLALSALAGWRWALALLFGSAAAIALSAALVRALAAVFDLSALALPVAAVLALAASAEVSSALAYRARDLPSEAGQADRVEAAIAEGGRDGLLWVAFALLAGVVAALTGFAQAGALGAGILAGALAGFAIGLLVGLGLLAAGIPAPGPRLGPVAALAARLAGRSTGWTPPGRRLLHAAGRALTGAGLIVVLCGLAAVALALSDQLTRAFASEPPAGLGGAAIACALSAALAIVAGRTALSFRAYRENAALGAAPGEAAERTVDAGLPGAVSTALLVGLPGVLLLVPELGAAGEFGVVVAAALLFDALVGRLASAVCWARLG